MGGERWAALRVVAAGLLAFGSSVLLLAVWRSHHRTDLAVYGAFAFPVAAGAAGLVARLYRSGNATPGIAPDYAELERFADELAFAVKDQWTRAAGDRGLLAPEPIPVRWRQPSRVLAAPASAAISSRRFPPLPGLSTVGMRQLRQGKVGDLHSLYGGLGSGRLVIAGPAGAGKSGAAVLLVLAALRHREQSFSEDRPQIPVPLIFTLQGWDPGRQLAQSWLIGRLQEAYPLFAGKKGAARAAGLLAAGSLAIILDGLDEVPKDLRPIALRALSQQATFRLVVLTRSAEMADAITQGLLDGAAAVELQDVMPSVAAGYLTSVQADPPPGSWHELIRRLHHAPNSPLALALSTPLALTLVKDTYRQGDDVRELLDYCDKAGSHATPESILDQLLDRVLPVAYTQRPGEPVPYFSITVAENILRRLAAQMNRDGTRDLRWWRLRTLVPSVVRILASTLMSSFMGALTGGLSAVILVFSVHPRNIGAGTFLAEGVAFGSVVGGLLGLVGALVFGMEVRAPAHVGLVSMRTAFGSSRFVVVLLRGLFRGLVGGLVGGMAAGLILGIIITLVAGSQGNLMEALLSFVIRGAELGTALGLILGPVVAIDRALTRPDLGRISPMSPADSWRGDQNYGFLLGFVMWTVVVIISLLVGVLTGFDHHVAGWIEVSVMIGLGFGLAVGFSYPAAWGGRLAFAYLRLRWHAPLRLMHFLEDAKNRGILRTIGPTYQFRHARLQDRLAAEAQFPSAKS
jgi:hypothetical protein